ncbi:MAG: hypothetical protein D4R74_05935 [Betaproteobacteria bacterium]|nr:MAG: hypothetical protein D4R74_05935 [Betaproteobacteria bacterium]
MGGGARINSPQRQRGLALLVLLALFALTGVYMLVSALNQSSVSLTLARAEKNRTALRDAKAALITWSAAQAMLTATLRPGSLPCPDRNNDGIAESSCTSANRLGRLPYKTLGIDPIYDASGELLWYGLSGNFRTTSTINSDTAGQLTLYNRDAQGNETIVQSGTVAVLLAPGTRLGTQDRSWSGASCSATTDPCNIASNYLEGRNGDSTTTDYVAAVETLTDPTVANLFNDQLLAITRQDLFAAIEPAIAARIERDIVRQYIYDSDTSLTDSANQWSDTSSNRNKSRYFDAWAGFPFAAPFASPGSSTFTGTAGTLEGLLPMVSNLSYTWSSGSVTQTGGTGTVWGGSSCAPANSNTDLRCNIWYISGAPRIGISGSVSNVGRSFVQLTRLSDVSCSGCSLSSRTLTGSLNSAGNGIVNLDATMSSVGGSWTNVTVTINSGNLITSPLISTTDSFAGWFNNNGWYKQTYYAVSPGYAPGGAGSCTAGGTCLTVNNLRTAPTDDKRAILIFAGRSLANATRPNATLSDYLENQNASTGDRVFEHGLSSVSSAGTAINDRVIVVAP